MTNPGQDNLTDEVTSQVICSIFSGSDYANNSAMIFENLAQRSKPYTTAYLNIIKEILTSDQYPPAAKFYALYLFVKSTENNEYVLSLMGNNKDLLNYLFKSVQFDYKKPVTERGQSFFSKAPSPDQSIIGHNYVIMLLEAFNYWNLTYGTTDTSNPLHVYQKMFSSLTKQVKFPEKFGYVGIDQQITDDFHLKPVENLPQRDKNSPTKPNKADLAIGNMANVLQGLNQEEDKEMQQQREQKAAAILNDLLECVNCGLNFELNNQSLVSPALKGKADYNSDLLEGITTVLETLQIPGTSKFYALLLLVRITEKQDQTFNSQLANDKKLIAKLSKDGNIDNDKPEEERGLTLFTSYPQSEDGIVGKNYLTLLLEAVQFWGKLYKTAEKGSPFYKFRVLYSSLVKTAKFPKEYTFVTKKLNAASAQNNLSLSKIGYVETLPRGGPMVRKENPFTDLAKSHVEECIRSGESYQRRVYEIVDKLEGMQGRDYMEAFFSALEGILKSEATPPLQRLYALWLLIKTSEKRNVVLVDALSQEEGLLNAVLEAAQLDYEKPFDQKGLQVFPESQAIGNKYVNIAIEATKYWAQTYGSSDKTAPRYTYSFMFQSLEAQMKFPRQFTYIGTPFDTDVMTLGPQVGQKPWEEYEKRENVAQPIGGGSSQTNDPHIQAIEGGLGRLSDGKIQLKGFLESNPKENREMGDLLDYFVLEIDQLMREGVQPHIEPLIGTAAGERYVTQAFAEGEVVENLSKEHKKYKSKKSSYSDFRKKALSLLDGANPNAGDLGGSSSNKPTIGGGMGGMRDMGAIPEGDDFSGQAMKVNETKRSVRGKAFEEEKTSISAIPSSGISGGGMNSGARQIGGKPSPFARGREQEIPKREEKINPSPVYNNSPVSIQPTSSYQMGTKTSPFMSNSPANTNIQQPTTSSYQRTEMTYANPGNQYIQQNPYSSSPYNQSMGGSMSTAKKPVIIGADSIPLSKKHNYSGGFDAEDDFRASQHQWNNDPYGGDNLRLRSASPTQNQYNQFMGQNQLGQNDTVAVNLIKSFVHSEATKTYLMETRFKWLSHYRFKAGGLQEDRDDPVIRSQQLRSEELLDDEDLPSKPGSPLKEVIEEDAEEMKESIPVVEVEKVEEKEKEKEKKGAARGSDAGLRVDTDPNNQNNMRESLSTLRSPVGRRGFGMELSGIERGIRSSSKVKAADLAKIENSMRASFNRSGKLLPAALGVQDIEAREELEKENAKLRQENSRLLRENKYLKEEVEKKKNSTGKEEEIEEMKYTIARYDDEVSQLKEEVTYLKDQNAKLTHELTSVKEEGKIQKPQSQINKPLAQSQSQETMKFLQLTKNASEGEREKKTGSISTLGGRSTHKNKRSIFERVSYDKPQFLITADENFFKNGISSPKIGSLSGLKDKDGLETQKMTSFDGKNQRNYMSPSPFGTEDVHTKRTVSPRQGFDTSIGNSARNLESAREEKKLRQAESPYVGVFNDTGKQPKQEEQAYYIAGSGDKERLAEDSELDIKGMISSRKDENQKEIRGKQIKGDVALFTSMKENMTGPLSVDDLLRFRVACLKSKCPLYDNDVVQIGVVSSLVHDNSGQRNILKLSLYYGNKTKLPLTNFKATISNGKNVTKLIKPDLLEGDIEPGKQLKQQVAISFKTTPFECLQIEAEVSIEHKPVQFTLYLPSVITKFMEFKYVSAEEFRERWKSKTLTVLKTEEIELDSVVVRSTYDFKKYFGYLVDLKPMDEYDFVQGKKGIKMGGVFELDLTNVDYMLKINLLPGHKVVFQVACLEEKTDIATFLLQTLKLLFQKSERQ